MAYLRPLLQTGICSALLLLLWSCGGSGSGASLQSIQITPNSASAAAGTSTQLMATGIYSDGGHRDITYDVTWSSSVSAVANINAGGVANAAAQGVTTVSAALQGVTGSSTLTVIPATLTSIEVTPSLTSIAKGRTLQYVATGIFSDNSTQDLTGQVTWASSNVAAATISSVSGSMGLATAAGTGTTAISAASGAISGSTTLTVTGAVLTALQITPGAPSIAKGVSQPFIAMGIFSDNSTQNLTTQVTWSSSLTGVATVSNSAPTVGTVTATGTGTTSLSASTGSLSTSIQVIVTPASLVSIQVTPPKPSIASGLSQPFTAIGIYTDNSTQDLTITATWATSAANVATVSNATGSQGVATSSNPGSTTISASLNGLSGSAALTVTPATLVSIAVTPANPTIPKGLTEQMVATGTYTDHSTQDLTTKVTFGTSASAVATISNAAGSQGLATSASVGSTIITASLGGVAGTTTLTIGAPNLVSIQVTATNHSVAGINQTQQFVATGTYTDSSTQPLTTQVLWSPSSMAVATVSNAPGSQGVATSVSVGNITITAALGTISGSSNFSVTPAVLQSIAVTPAGTSIYTSAPPLQMVATGTYNDLTTQVLSSGVTWTSSNMSVATISPTQGLATAAGAGMTTITAAVGSISGTTTLFVTAVSLSSITVTLGAPVSHSDTHTVTQQATATGTNNDGHPTSPPLTFTWSSSDTNVATITTSPAPSPVLVTWTGVGTTTITATVSTTSGSANLTVAVPSSLEVTPAGNITNPVVITGIGFTQQFVAMGSYSSGSLDITRLVHWSPSASGVATIDATGVATSALVATDGTTVTNTTSITASIGAPAITASQILEVNESFGMGPHSVYSLMSSVKLSVGLPSNAMLACSNCHVANASGSGVVQGTAFYASTASGTFSLMNGTYDYFTNGTGSPGVYHDACVSPPSASMPNYSGTEFCSVLYQWLTQGTSVNTYN